MSEPETLPTQGLGALWHVLGHAEYATVQRITVFLSFEDDDLPTRSFEFGTQADPSAITCEPDREDNKRTLRLGSRTRVIARRFPSGSYSGMWSAKGNHDKLDDAWLKRGVAFR